MRKPAALAVLALAGVAAPARADKPASPKGPHPAHCVAHAEGFAASGTLVSSNLTRRADGRYSGTLVVNVAKANHRVPTGAAETYTLTDARVRFHHGVSATAGMPRTSTARRSRCSTTRPTPRRSRRRHSATPTGRSSGATVRDSRAPGCRRSR